MSDEPRKPPADEAQTVHEDADSHASPEELVAFYRRELSPRERQRLQQHFSRCRHCADLVLDLIHNSLLPTPPPEERLSDEERRRDWEELLRRLAELRDETV